MVGLSATGAREPEERQELVSGADEPVGEAGGAGPLGGPAPGAPPVEVVYYTDPLCCWSWAFEPHWRRLRAEFGAALDCRYRMAGMIADWGSYSDPLNSVSRPLQMGPIWREAQHLAGVLVDDGSGSRIRRPRPIPRASRSMRRSCNPQTRRTSTCGVCARPS